MKIRELLKELLVLVEHNDIGGDTDVVLCVGCCKGIVRTKLKEDDETFPGSVISFIGDAAGVGLDDDGSVVIRGGPELEIPPCL